MASCPEACTKLAPLIVCCFPWRCRGKIIRSTLCFSGDWTPFLFICIYGSCEIGYVATVCCQVLLHWSCDTLHCWQRSGARESSSIFAEFVSDSFALGDVSCCWRRHCAVFLEAILRSFLSFAQFCFQACWGVNFNFNFILLNSKYASGLILESVGRRLVSLRYIGEAIVPKTVVIGQSIVGCWEMPNVSPVHAPFVFAHRDSRWVRVQLMSLQEVDP